MKTTLKVLTILCLTPLCSVADDNHSWMDAPPLFTAVRPVYVQALGRVWPEQQPKTIVTEGERPREDRLEVSTSRQVHKTTRTFTAPEVRTQVESDRRVVTTRVVPNHFRFANLKSAVHVDERRSSNADVTASQSVVKTRYPVTLDSSVHHRRVF